MIIAQGKTGGKPFPANKTPRSRCRLRGVGEQDTSEHAIGAVMMIVMVMMAAAHEGEPHAPAHEGRTTMIPRTAEQERENEEDCDEPQHDDSSFRFSAEQWEQKRPAPTLVDTGLAFSFRPGDSRRMTVREPRGVPRLATPLRHDDYIKFPCAFEEGKPTSETSFPTIHTVNSYVLKGKNQRRGRGLVQPPVPLNQEIKSPGLQ